MTARSVDETVARGHNGVDDVGRCIRLQPGFSQTEEINRVVRYELLKKTRFIQSISDRGGRTNIEAGESEITGSSNRSGIEFNVTGEQQQQGNQEMRQKFCALGVRKIKGSKGNTK